MFKLQFYILLVIYVHNSSCVIDRLYDIGKHLWVLYTIVDDLNLTKNHEASEVYDHFSNDQSVYQESVTQMYEIHKRLTKLERFTNPKTIGDLFESVASDTMVKKNINTIELSVQSIDDAYNEFHEHMDIEHIHTVQVLEDLTRHVIVKVEGKIEVIRKILTDGHEFLINNQTLLSVIAKEAVQQYNVMCDNTKTVSNALVQIFTMAMIAELKVNVMLLFVNSYRYSGNEGWKVINALAREQFEKQFATYTNAFQLTIDVTDALYMRRCDPPGIWSKGYNFVELEEAVQVSIFHYDREKCGYYSCNSMWTGYSEYCSAEIYDTRTSCSGKSAECTWLDSIDACALKDGPRKFQYVNSSLGFYGKRLECKEPAGYNIKEWKTNKAVCGCNCYRNHNKISIVIAKSNELCNKVVVGLRFVRQDDTLHIQVREGLLQANGLVSTEKCASDGWVPLPKMSEGSYETLDKDTNAFFLDDLRLPPEHVLIGVKFNKVTRGSVTGFALEIIGTKFNYKSGRMYAIFSLDRYIKSMSDPRKELKYTRKSSDEIEVPHEITPVSIGYVRLQRSDLTDDFGQTTLPFFDSMPVITDPPSVLGGVGLFHKGVEGYAGFISMRVYPIFYTPYFIDFNHKKVKNYTVLFNLPEEEVDLDDPLNYFNKIHRIRDD